MRVPPRRLTVLVSIDVAGFTRLVEEDERGTLSELAAIRLKIMRPTREGSAPNARRTPISCDRSETVYASNP